MPDFRQAMQKLITNDPLEGFADIAKLFNEGNFDEKVLADLEAAFWMPNLEEMEKNYQENVAVLKNYPFIFSRDFIPPHQNYYRLFPMTDKLFYRFNQHSQMFDVLETYSDVETAYFFEDLSKPLLLENEYCMV